LAPRKLRKRGARKLLAEKAGPEVKTTRKNPGKMVIRRKK